ncbi:MAG: hypothetical protein EAZ97_06660 [Bacteroidetes bacterium]|nr:MAG: hypothetical protein EAZ97_06660 [Bacteroidota bacterium]
MTKEDITKIENKLGFTLPEHYKKFQLNYPKELTELEYSCESISNDADWVIRTNMMMYLGHVPKSFMSIGEDVGGNYFFIRTDISKESVYYIDHEEASEVEEGLPWESYFTKEYKDLQELKEKLIANWS